MVFRFSIYTRLLACARRIARASESTARSLDILARIETSRWEKDSRVRVGEPKPTEFGALDLTEANRAFHRQRQEEGVEDAEGNPL